MSKSNLYIASLVLLIFGCFTFCEAPKDEPQRAQKYGGILRINTTSIPDLIFPGKVLKTSEQIIINQVYDGLVKYHPRTLELVPSLANNWLEERNGTIYTFYLRTNAQFHEDPCFKNPEDKIITAQDVKYSIEQISRMHLAEGHKLSAQINNIKGAEDFTNHANIDSANISGIEAFDDTTLIFYLHEANPMFIHFLAGSNSLVFAQEAFEEYGLDNTVGSGAFTFEYPEQTGKAIYLKANPNYYGSNIQKEKLPFIDSIQVSFIVSTSRELEMLENDQLDLILDLTKRYITPFLDNHIDDFQQNPPYYSLKQISNANNDLRYHILRAYINGFELNAQGYFDFSETYLMEPDAENIERVE